MKATYEVRMLVTVDREDYGGVAPSLSLMRELVKEEMPDYWEVNIDSVHLDNINGGPHR